MDCVDMLWKGGTPVLASPRSRSLLAMGLAMLALFTIVGIMEVSNPGGINEDSPAAVALALLLIGVFLIVLLALALGIAGLCQKERCKTFAIMGAAISAVILLGIGLLMIIGIVAG